MNETFTQKWAIISLLEEVEDGYQFLYTDTPLHVTLAGVFKIDLSGKLLAAELQRLLAQEPSFEIEADAKDMFGPNNDIAVMRINSTPELMRLYEKIYHRLEELGAEYNSPEYQGAGFAPHSTFQKSGRLTPGEKRRITSVSLIDLFPDGDGYQRKVFKTIDLLPWTYEDRT